MKTLLLIALSLLLLGCTQKNESPQAPTAVADLRGQWVVINYWAQWCKPCIAEIPELNALDANFDDITVLGVNYDGATGDDLAQQIQQLGVAFTVLAEDPAAELGVPRPIVLPTTFIVTPQGQVAQTLLGPQTLESLTAAVREIPNGDAVSN